MALRRFQRVIKVGDSLAVVLPTEVTRGLEIQRGMPIMLAVLAANIVQIKFLTDYEVQQLGMAIPEIE